MSYQNGQSSHQGVASCVCVFVMGADNSIRSPSICPVIRCTMMMRLFRPQAIAKTVTESSFKAEWRGGRVGTE